MVNASMESFLYENFLKQNAKDNAIIYVYVWWNCVEFRHG